MRVEGGGRIDGRRVKMYRLTHPCVARLFVNPTPGSWLPVFEIVSMLAVLTNSAIICFTSVQLPLLFPNMSKLMQFGIVVIFEVCESVYFWSAIQFVM